MPGGGATPYQVCPDVCVCPKVMDMGPFLGFK